MPNPPTKKYLNALVDACARLAVEPDPHDAGRDLARPAYPARVHRAAPAPATAVAVLQRDGYCCRYCGARVVPGAVLRAAALVWPDELPHDASRRPDTTHPLFLTSEATFDVVAPLALDRAEEESTFVTACWGCAAQKGELSLKRLGWELRKPREVGWEGLVGSYEALLLARKVEALSTGERSYHARWLRAFGLDADVLKRWARAEPVAA
jgi:5-methylcytosine-specific restriction endonuclease McrA